MRPLAHKRPFPPYHPTHPPSLQHHAAIMYIGRAIEKVRRIGYSVVEPNAWIRPHTGVDNRQLKLHLGLVVPPGDCAAFTIEAETRAWRENKVAFFDDSFEHHVWNNCSTARAVLQLVIAHPML